MIQVKPAVTARIPCPHCGAVLSLGRLRWIGVHVCADAKCPSCQAELVADLPVGHAINTPFLIDLQRKQLVGPEKSREWFGKPLLEALNHPSPDVIPCEVEIRRPVRRAVILDCIDFLYGHSLLKLLNATRHLDSTPELGLVVIVPRFLRWLVPADAAEVWTVDLPLAKARQYFPSLESRFALELERFDEVFLSRAHSHPKDFAIERFSREPPHDFARDDYRITFIWREDRPWLTGGERAWRRLKKLGLAEVAIARQNAKVRRLFSMLRKDLPRARFSVAGLGTRTRFPAWIDDQRVAKFTEALERTTCRVYSESRLVIGVHGSNMLLPSAHAGFTVDLMPPERWGNLAQDVIFQEPDPRLASYRYRFVSIETPISTLRGMIHRQIREYDHVRRHFLNLLPGEET